MGSTKQSQLCDLSFPFDKAGKHQHLTEYKVLPSQELFRGMHSTGTILTVGLFTLKAKHNSSDALQEGEKAHADQVSSSAGDAK